jgi:hypothetical protein
MIFAQCKCIREHTRGVHFDVLESSVDAEVGRWCCCIVDWCVSPTVAPGCRANTLLPDNARQALDDSCTYPARIVMDNTGMSEAEASARGEVALHGFFAPTEKAGKFGILTLLTAALWPSVRQRLGGQRSSAAITGIKAVDFGYFFGRRRV